MRKGTKKYGILAFSENLLQNKSSSDVGLILQYIGIENGAPSLAAEPKQLNGLIGNQQR